MEPARKSLGAQDPALSTRPRASYMPLRRRLANGPHYGAQPGARLKITAMGHRSRPFFVLLAVVILGANLSAARAQGPDTRSRDAPSLDAAAFAALEIAETEAVVEIVDGDTLVLADGRQVRLVGLQMIGSFIAFHPGPSSTQKLRINTVISP